MAHRQCHAVGRRGTDQRRTAHQHIFDRPRGIRHGVKCDGFKHMGKFRLVDDLDGSPFEPRPYGAEMLAVDVQLTISHSAAVSS